MKSSESAGRQSACLARGFSLKCAGCKPLEMLAERGGFEPPVELLTLRRFSKPLLSTTQPPLREGTQGTVSRLTQPAVNLHSRRIPAMFSGDGKNRQSLPAALLFFLADLLTQIALI